MLLFSRNGDDESPYFCVLFKENITSPPLNTYIIQNREPGKILGKMISRF